MFEKFHLNLSSHSEEEDFSIFSFKTICLSKHVTYSVIIFLFHELLCNWRSRNFKFFRCSFIRVKFSRGHHFTDDVTKIHTSSPWGVIAMCQVSIFSIVPFRRYRGLKLFGFSKMAPVSRDLWRHNYQLHILRKKKRYILRWKFRVDRSNGCQENEF